MGYSCVKYKGHSKTSLIVSNHVTDVDPVLLALSFYHHMYFLSSEHAFRAGFASKVLKTLFAPIPFNKTKTDVSAIKEVLYRLKNGADVCIFPEGDRSFTGTSVGSSLSIAKLAKSSGVDLITFRIEGGYFTWPRWSKKKRKGKMSGGVVSRYSSSDIQAMTDEQVLEIINRDIYTDAYERQKTAPVRYRGHNLAENIETALYLCPGCNRIGTIKSDGNRFFCECGLSGIYTETGYLQGHRLPFSTTTDWGRWQEQNLEAVIKNIGGGLICEDDWQQLFEVHHAEYKVPVGEGIIQIGHEVFRCCGKVFPLESITKFAIVGQMTLLFAVKEGAIYEVRSLVPRSALKYREIFRVLTGRH